MIGAVRPISAQTPTKPQQRRPADEAPGDGRARAAEGRLPAVIEVTAREKPGRQTDVRPSAPFVVQLIVNQLNRGDRRIERQPQAVAGRAIASYQRADRLSSNLEPGFFGKREM